MALRTTIPRVDWSQPINNGLVAWWPMWENAGGKALDIAGKNNHGTLTNGPAWAGDGLKFDGADDYLVLPDMSSSFSSQATLNMWVKLRVNVPAAAPQTGFVYLGTSDVASHYPWTDGSIYLGTFLAARQTLGDIGIDRTVWHMVTITSAPGAGSWKFYQNGVLYYSGTGDASVNIGTLGWLGRSQTTDTSFYLDGKINNARLFNRALSAQEIQRLYQSPNAGLWIPDITRYYFPAAGGSSIVPIVMRQYRARRAA